MCQKYKKERRKGKARYLTPAMASAGEAMQESDGHGGADTAGVRLQIKYAPEGTFDIVFAFNLSRIKIDMECARHKTGI